MTEGDFSFPPLYRSGGIIYMYTWGKNGKHIVAQKKCVLIGLKSEGNLSLGS